MLLPCLSVTVEAKRQEQRAPVAPGKDFHFGAGIVKHPAPFRAVDVGTGFIGGVDQS